MSLGSWHVYKQAHNMVWGAWGYMFLGPMFHALVPHQKIRKHPALSQLETLFTYVRLSYPQWKGRLSAALVRNNGEAPWHNLLQNLRDLCELLIPLVRVSAYDY